MEPAPLPPLDEPPVRRAPSPAVPMIVSGLVAGIVLASVTFVLTWMLAYQLGGGATTPESADIARLWSTSAAATFAVLAFVVGCLLGSLVGWLGHRRRWPNDRSAR